MARILLIDDSTDMLAMLQTMLEKRGSHQVSVARNGQEGLELAFAEQPDLALVDVMMPGINGYEVVKRLRSNERTQRMAIIVLTARGQLVDRDAAMTAGADLHMAKPVDIEELEEQINTLLEARRAASPERPQSITFAVMSLKGGTGVTTLSVNLASLLQQQHPTILIDLSPNSGHCATALGLRPAAHWGHFLENPSTPTASLLLEHSSGLRVLPSPPIPYQYGWFSADSVELLLAELQMEGGFIVIDMPPMLDDVALAALRSANTIVLLTGDDPSALQTTLTTLQALQEWKERIWVVRNATVPGVRPPHEAIQRTLRTGLVADLPYDPTQTVALRKGAPLALSQPRSPVVVGLHPLLQRSLQL